MHFMCLVKCSCNVFIFFYNCYMLKSFICRNKLLRFLFFLMWNKKKCGIIKSISNSNFISLLHILVFITYITLKI